MIRDVLHPVLAKWVTHYEEVPNGAEITLVIPDGYFDEFLTRSITLGFTENIKQFLLGYDPWLERIQAASEHMLKSNIAISYFRNGRLNPPFKMPYRDFVGDANKIYELEIPPPRKGRGSVL